jgi:iron complex outermembrane receptor protein
MRHAVTFAIIVVPALTLAASEPTPQDLKRLSIEQLMRIDVTLATRCPEPMATAPTVISVVTGEDIRRSGVTTLADAIGLADGIHIARFNTGTRSVTARGVAAVAANKMIVMIDGRTVYNPLVLNDVGMPREDGYELIRQLRSRPTVSGGGIPAVAVTALCIGE